jgi:hypothetical protein
VRRAPPASARPLLSPVAAARNDPHLHQRPSRRRRRAPGRRAPRDRYAGAAAPVPAAYGLSPPLFQPLTAYAARGRIFPAPARENPAPRVKSTPPAGPPAQGWTGASRHQGSSGAEVVEAHPLAISQDRPSRPKPTGQGRSSGRALHLDPWALPSYPEGGRRREDEPPPGERAYAPTPETTGQTCVVQTFAAVG